MIALCVAAALMAVCAAAPAALAPASKHDICHILLCDVPSFAAHTAIHLFVRVKIRLCERFMLTAFN